MQNHRVISEKRRKSVWTITAWASALYALHVVGLTQQGPSKLQAHMMYQLRFVLRSYSQETRETNQELLRRQRLPTAQHQLQRRVSQFVQRQVKSDPTLTPLYLPRAERLLNSLQQLSAPEEVQLSQEDTLVTCGDCGAALTSTGALRRHMNKSRPDQVINLKGPKFDPKRRTMAGFRDLQCLPTDLCFFLLPKKAC